MTTVCRQCATLFRDASLVGLITWIGAIALAAHAQDQNSILHRLASQDSIPASPFSIANQVPSIEAPQPATAQDGSAQEGVEVLMRGPLHEAFATVQQANPAPSPIIQQKPPAPIEESIPDFKPEGQNVQWIAGYWAWDDSTDQYIWISGLWRDIPPGQRFVPGYWEELNPGYRWISGFWTSAESNEVTYLPQPPESLEVGPSSEAPSDGYFYTPGNWIYQHSTYQWSPGYWQPCVPDWVWVPSRYVWTPCGFVYCRGYWDRLFDVRAVAFAPVRFVEPIYLRPRFAYRPWCRITTGANFYVHLFVRPNYGHYYFGDWYGDHYARRGFCGWSHYPTRYRAYDPHYSYYLSTRARYLNVSFVSWVNDRHRDCNEHVDYRPHHVYGRDHDHDHDSRSRRESGSPYARRQLVDPIDETPRQVVDVQPQTGTDLPRQPRLRRVSDEERTVARKTLDPSREIQNARRKLETAAAKSPESTALPRSGRTIGSVRRPENELVKLKLPQSDMEATKVPPLVTRDNHRTNPRGDTARSSNELSPGRNRQAGQQPIDRVEASEPRRQATTQTDSSANRGRRVGSSTSPATGSSKVIPPVLGSNDNRSRSPESRSRTQANSPVLTEQKVIPREFTPPGRGDRYGSTERAAEPRRSDPVPNSREPTRARVPIEPKSIPESRNNKIVPERVPGLRTDRTNPPENRSQSAPQRTQRSFTPKNTESNQLRSAAQPPQSPRLDATTRRSANSSPKIQSSNVQPSRNNPPQARTRAESAPRVERSQPNLGRSAAYGSNPSSRSSDSGGSRNRNESAGGDRRKKD